MYLTECGPHASAHLCIHLVASTSSEVIHKYLCVSVHTWAGAEPLCLIDDEAASDQVTLSIILMDIHFSFSSVHRNLAWDSTTLQIAVQITQSDITNQLYFLCL